MQSNPAMTARALGGVARPRWTLLGHTTLVMRQACARSPRTLSSASASVAYPTRTQLWHHALTCAVPMVGFGFMECGRRAPNARAAPPSP